MLNPAHIFYNRHLIYPFFKEELLHFMARKSFFVSKSQRLNYSRLASLKDCHKGERCFVIGNGPSLRIDDLKLLKKEISFASNKIYLAFDETDWRPTYYVAEDGLFIKKNYQQITHLAEPVKFFPFQTKALIPPIKDAVYFKLVYEYCYPKSPNFSINALDRVYGGNTVTYLLIQLACFMGIREIYLLGVDFDYKIPQRYFKKPGDHYKIYISRGEQNHFHPDYIKPGETLYDPNLERHEKAYLAARDAIEKLGGKIYNATRGGKLEIFPRMNFNSLISDQ